VSINDVKMNNKKESMKIVIVGHVDHGKSTLIGRLLYDTESLPEGKIEEIKLICESLGKRFEVGYILDSLEEERDQNVTIDTTQIFFKTNKRDYTIIDAPGHVEFIKNMITGASQAEAAILIVDAEEGIQEQTRRHAYILKFLGLKQIIVVINKMDLVNYREERFEGVRDDLVRFLLNIDIKPSIVIPISAREGDNIAKKSNNMQWYDEKTVLESLDTLKNKISLKDRELRLPIQDYYTFDKRIFVGKIESGRIKKGDEILILPTKEKTKIRSIEEFLKNPEEAEAGKSIGITTEDKVFIDRGYIIVKPEEKQPIIDSKIKVNMFWMGRTPIKKGERINLRCTTQEVMCEIDSINKIINSSTLEIKEDKGEIKDKEAAEIIIKTEKPIIIENFDNIEEMGRFVLEREDIVAVGIILE